jgi:hypothetical protein
MIHHGMPLFKALDLDLSIGGAQTCCIITNKVVFYGPIFMSRLSSVFFDDADSSGSSDFSRTSLETPGILKGGSGSHS